MRPNNSNFRHDIKRSSCIALISSSDKNFNFSMNGSFIFPISLLKTPHTFHLHQLRFQYLETNAPHLHRSTIQLPCPIQRVYHGRQLNQMQDSADHFHRRSFVQARLLYPKKKYGERAIHNSLFSSGSPMFSIFQCCKSSRES